MRRGGARVRGRAAAAFVVALAAAAVLSGAGSSAPAQPSSGTTGCTPGAALPPDQIALFTQTGFKGTCAFFKVGAYPLVTGTGGIPDNSANSLEVPPNLYAVLHKNPTFGGSNDDNWAAFPAGSYSDLSKYVYQGTTTPVAGSVSALWVMQTGCTPGPNQVAVFDLPNFGGGCVLIKPGTYANMPLAGVPADFVGSLIDGAYALTTIYQNPSQGGKSCSYGPGQSSSTSFPQGITNAVCFGDANASSITVSLLPVTTSATVTLTKALSGGSSTEIAGSVTGLASTTYTLAFYADTTCGAEQNQLGTTKVTTDATGHAAFDAPTVGPPAAPVGSLVSATATEPNHSPSAPSTCIAAVGPVTTSATVSLSKAVPGSSSTEIAGSLSGLASTTYTLTFYADTTCGAEQTLLGTTQVTTDATGSGAFDKSVGTASAGAGSFVSATATEPNHRASVPSTCITAGAAPDNTSWPNALPIPADGTGTNGTIDLSGQSRWYKFSVAPGEKLQVNLTNLPANYDLALFSDIGQSFVSLNSTSDLQKLSAEFAPSSFAPSSFAPSSFAPSSFAPSSFAPSSFAPSSFAPSSFAPSSFAPSSFAPSSFANFTDSNNSFEAAQATSLIAYSAADGTSDEQIVANTWNNTGTFYIRVTGRNGAFSPGAPFTVSVNEDGNSCANVQPMPNTALLSPPATVPTGKTTLILEDTSRMSGPVDATTLSAFAQKVGGAIVDVGSQSPRVAALFAQADANPSCVYAENLVADAIGDIVTLYRASNPALASVVIFGTDHAIPFFRYPDASGLGTESNYVPPVADATASQASLRLNYVLSQDAYGADTTLHLNGIDVPIPDLPVGRLVETPSEITGMLAAFMAANGAVSPTSSLVTGYDFLAGAAQEVQGDFSAKLGAANADSLIAPQGTPLGQSWTANDLRQKLLGSSHGLIFLAGHFSADNALAADGSTTMNSSELAASSVNLQNSIVFSAGCHAGYNIVDGDAIPGVTQPLDWVQAFAQKQATVIAGTGYQYGDTDFVAYNAKLYASFAQDLVAGGTAGIGVGDALVAAKQQYLAGTTQPSGIDLKSLLETTLYGLPMLDVKTPAAGPSSVQTTAAPSISPTPVGTDPGKSLGLSSADQDFPTPLTTHTTTLTDPTTGNTVTATHLEGPDGVVTGQGVPALPLQTEDATVNGQVLRGVGFRGGTFTDTPGITPLTGDVATDQSGPHSPFVSSAFFPERPWNVNYFPGLSDGSTSTELMLTPAQYMSDAPNSLTDTQRAFSDLSLRLYYSANTSGAASGAAPPSIARVDATSTNGVVTFSVHVVGDPAAGIQGVWVTYRPLTGNQWQSLDLTQDKNDTTLWTGTLTTSAIEFMVQAVNGVGLVSLDTNAGVYYQPDQIPPALQTGSNQTATSLSLGVSNPSSAPYGSSVTLTATLTSTKPVAGQAVTFTIGDSIRTGVIVASPTATVGTASVTLPVIDLPGTNYTVTAAFGGDATLAGTSVSEPSFEITPLGTSLSLLPAGLASVIAGANTGITAKLTAAANGALLPQRTIEFVLTQGNPAKGGTEIIQTRITDISGVAALGVVPGAPSGTYAVAAFFGPGGPTPPSVAADPVYTPSAASSAAVSSITLAGKNPSNAATVSWNVTFNEPVVGVAASNFSLVGDGTITGVSVSGSGDGSTYTVTASTGADGSLGLSLSTSAGIEDSVGGPLTGTFTGPSYTIDKTAPTITATASPAPNANGWNSSNVIVTFSCADNPGGSGIDTCPAPVTLTTEGANQSASGTAVDKAGNSATATVSGINIDETRPTITATASPAPNASGWNSSNVTVTFTCTDSGSGFAPDACPAPVILTEGGSQSASGTVSDLAGNSATATVNGINVDETAPTVTVTGVSQGAVYTVGSVPSAGCSTSDSLSGVGTNATVNVTSVTGGPTGTQTATCSGGKDVAGNTAPPVSVSYTVAGSLGGGTTTCNGTFGGSATNVTVPAGAVCTLVAGTTVTGNISVLQGGALDDEGAIGGNIGATGAAWIKISGGTISGNVGISGLTATPPGLNGTPGGDNKICGATITGNVSVSSGGANAPTDIGNVGSCNGGSGLMISGNLTVQGNAGPLQIGGNNVKGTITVSGNTGGGTLTGNSAGAACNLGSNVPGIVGSSNTGVTGNTCNATA